MVHHRGGHTSYYNSKALELAGVNKDTPNRMGGTYDHDENGELNGRVTDRARDVFNNVGKRETFTAEKKEQRDRDGLAYISKQFVRYGLTSVHHEGGDLFTLQQVRARGELQHRVSFETSGDILEAMIKNGISSGFGDEWIRDRESAALLVPSAAIRGEWNVLLNPAHADFPKIKFRNPERFEFDARMFR